MPRVRADHTGVDGRDQHAPDWLIAALTKEFGGRRARRRQV